MCGWLLGISAVQLIEVRDKLVVPIIPKKLAPDPDLLEARMVPTSSSSQTLALTIAHSACSDSSHGVTYQWLY